MRYSIISLGCPKNLVDTERMAALLSGAGFAMEDDPERADILLVNTCGFIGDAREESYDAIEAALQWKSRGLGGSPRKVLVAGCLTQRENEELPARFPEVDAWVGVFGREDIARVARRLFEDDGTPPESSPFQTIERPTPEEPSKILHVPEGSASLTDENRSRLTEQHVAYLKLSEGCNRRCAFCIIPQIRGPQISKPLEQVESEARRLAEDGVKELVLIAQDTSAYGIDLAGKPLLWDAIRRIEKIDGIRWIRLMYLYPQHMTDALIDLIGRSEKVVPYLDMPLQHINNKVLKRMRRSITRERTIEILDRLRQRIDNLILRTTFLVGFPGETRGQFDELVQFVANQRFQRVGVFAFSPEEGTEAADMDHQIDPQECIRRRDLLMEVQQPIAFDWQRNRVGTRIPVIVDRYIPEADNAWIGRSYADAPDIDGVVYLTGENLRPGQVVSAEIVDARGYDLIGVVLGESGQ